MNQGIVMICDDNEVVHKTLSVVLKSEGFDIISVYNGEDALKQLEASPVDVLILDIMLPGMSGLDVCRSIDRSNKPYIIMLSAKGEEIDRIVGLEIGADDYVVKPYSPREIALRVKKALERNRNNAPCKEKLMLEELTVLPDPCKVYVRDQEISLTVKEFNVLKFMMEHIGTALTREQILNNVWGYDYYGDTRIVDSMIQRIRQKLYQPDVHFIIRSLYGLGYRIEKKS